MHDIFMIGMNTNNTWPDTVSQAVMAIKSCEFWNHNGLDNLQLQLNGINKKQQKYYAIRIFFLPKMQT